MEFLKGVKDSSKDKRRVGGATAQAALKDGTVEDKEMELDYCQQDSRCRRKIPVLWGRELFFIMLISKRPAENWVSVGRQQ